MAQLCKRHIIAATEITFSFMNNPSFCASEKIVWIDQPFGSNHHGSIVTANLDKIAFPQAEVFTEPFGNNHLSSFSHSANGSGDAF